MAVWRLQVNTEAQVEMLIREKEACLTRQQKGEK